MKTTTLDRISIGTKFIILNKRGIPAYNGNTTYILVHKNNLNTIFEIDGIENDKIRKIVNNKTIVVVE